MFELDRSELVFQITFFTDDAPVKMEILADRGMVIAGRCLMIVRLNALVIPAWEWGKKAVLPQKDADNEGNEYGEISS